MMSTRLDEAIDEGEEPITVTSSQSTDQPRRNCCQKLFPYGYWVEFVELFHLAWPLVLSQLFQYFPGLVSIVFCGHLGEIYLCGVALANAVINITGISVAIGLSSACDATFGHLFGSFNRHKLGVALQRSLIILTLATLPCLAIHFNAEFLLLLFGQNSEASRLAGDYLLIFAPGLLCFFLYTGLSKYVQNQNIVIPNFIIGGLSNCINIVLHYILVYVADLKTSGSAISQSITYFLMFAMTVIYILRSKIYAATWEGWSLDCLREWGDFVYLSRFGFLSVFISWWTVEIGVILAGIIGTRELAAQSITFQLLSLALVLPVGVSVAVSIRINHYLTSSNQTGAITTARVSLTIAWMGSAIFLIIYMTLKDYLPLIFSSIPEIVFMTSTLLPLAVCYSVFDSSVEICGGILRSSGRQDLCFVVTFVGHFTALAIGIPLMYISKLGLQGLWWAFLIGTLIETIALVPIIIRADWQGQIAEAKEKEKLNQQLLETQLANKGNRFGRQHRHARSKHTETGGDDDEDEFKPLNPELTRTSFKPASRRYSSVYQVFLAQVQMIPASEGPLKELIFEKSLAIVSLVFIFCAGLIIRLASGDLAIFKIDT